MKSGAVHIGELPKFTQPGPRVGANNKIAEKNRT